MSVIVNEKMPIDHALRLLWREATRENVIKTLQANRYHVKPSAKRHAKTKIFAKIKKRRRAAARRSATKG